ncbi:phage tail protein [Pseudomonas sp. RL_5y_Pfl2_69]|uniref:phage tail protein n=1 Tax=Pseudomonas sp. RL_5y_Pfl2_69 TaxID=3088711 RepID=UPI0030D7196A
MEGTKRVITLDLAAQIQPEDRLILNLPSGKTEGRIVKSVAGHEVTLLADYSELPQPESSWSVESADLAVMRFRVQTIEPQGLHQFEIRAVQHEPGKYDAIDNGARIDPQPISIIPPGVMSPPDNIQIEARSSIAQGLAVTTMRISWNAAKGAVSYNVEWRKDSGSWIRLPSNGTLGAEVEGVYSGRYIARVSAVNALGVASVWGSSMEVLLAGKLGLPPAVTHLTTHSKLFEIGLKWGFPPGAEDTQRTEIWYSPSNSLENATKLSDLAYPQNDHRLQSLAAGAQFFFWARLVDRTGNIGPFFPEINGVMGQASAEAGPVLDLIAGKIGETELGKELLDRIEMIDGDGSGSVNERLIEAKKELEGLIGEITDALEYDNAKPYASGEVVRLGNRLFQAIAATTGHPPPDATYWLDMGTLAETTNALVLQVQKNSASIIEQDGKITAQGKQISAIDAKVTDPETGLEATASGLSSLTSTVETLDGKVTATAEKVDGVYALIDSGSAGDENGSAGDERASAGAESLMSVIAERDFAQAVRTDRVQAEVGETSAAVDIVSKAQAEFEGKASAMWSVKMQVNANGQLVTAGIGLGIETNAEGVLQSQFLVSADRFAVVGALAGGEVFTPFVVENGQVFMGSAFIQDGTITNAKVGDLSSTGWVAGLTGWHLGKDGTFENNGTSSSGGRMVQTSTSIRMYHPNGVTAIDLSL